MPDLSAVPVNGVLARLGFALEAVAGTPEAAPTQMVEMDSEQFGKVVTVEDEQGITGLRSHHEGSTFITTVASGGTFPAKNRRDILDFFLTAACGQSVGKCTLTIPSYTGFIDKVSSSHVIAGCKVANLQINGDANGATRLTVNMPGLSIADGAGGAWAAYYPDLTKPVLTGSMLTILLDGNDATIYSHTLEIDNGIDLDNYGNNTSRQSLQEIDRMVKLTIETAWNDDTKPYLDNYFNKSAFPVVYSLFDGTGGKQLTMSRMTLLGDPKFFTGREGQHVTFTGNAMVNGVHSATDEGAELVLADLP